MFDLDFSNLSPLTIIDFVLGGTLIYFIFKQLKGTIARNVVIGYLLVYLTYLLVITSGFKFLSAILSQFIRWGELGLIIIFQQEIRHFLQMIGRSATFQNSPILQKIFKPIKRTESKNTLETTIDAVKLLATAHTGALIVIQKNQDLERFAETGDEVDALVTKRLIMSIFNKNSPLHDGAMIIQNDRIRAVRCSLPISESGTISPNLGFRHRAAIGMSEQSDAAIIVVSEENGEIAMISTATIHRNLSIIELEEKLFKYFEK
jgi:diadenylate cyclase